MNYYLYIDYAKGELLGCVKTELAYERNRCFDRLLDLVDLTSNHRIEVYDVAEWQWDNLGMVRKCPNLRNLNYLFDCLDNFDFDIKQGSLV